MTKFYRYKTRADKAFILANTRRNAEEKRHEKRLAEIDRLYWIAVRGTLYAKKGE